MQDVKGYLQQTVLLACARCMTKPMSCTASKIDVIRPPALFIRLPALGPAIEDLLHLGP